MSAAAWVAFVVAGALGSVARHLVHGWCLDRGPELPWGTFAVNVTGSFVLGVLTGLGLYHGFPDTPRVVLGTGFCGAYTTFSTFTVDTIGLVEDGPGGAAALNALGTLVVGLAAAAAGLALAAR